MTCQSERRDKDKGETTMHPKDETGKESIPKGVWRL